MASYTNAGAAVKYARTLNAALQDNLGFLKALNNLESFTAPEREGAISVPLITAVTPGTPVDGTMLDNAGAVTLVAGTFVNQEYTISLQATELNQLTPERFAMHAIAAGSAFGLAAQNQILTDYMAATPGATTSLPSGQANFDMATFSDAQKGIVLQTILKGIGYVSSVSQGRMNELFVAVNAESWANLMAAKMIVGTDGDGKGFVQGGQITTSIAGVPIFVVPGSASGWGTASGTAAIIGHKDSAMIGFQDAFLHGGGAIAASDGLTKYIWLGPYVHGVIQNKWYEITNAVT